MWALTGGFAYGRYAHRQDLSRYLLTRGGAIPPGPGRPQVSTHQKVGKEKKGLIYSVDVWEAAILLQGLEIKGWHVQTKQFMMEWFRGAVAWKKAIKA